MIHLLDVNLLIALIDTKHIHHDAAHTWFDRHADSGWATCPLTQNGAIRIIGQSRYPNSPGGPAVVAETLKAVLRWPRHEFWTDDLSLMNDPLVDSSRLFTSDQVTDTYLLALAVKHGGKLATFDRRLKPDTVFGGQSALVLL